MFVEAQDVARAQAIPPPMGIQKLRQLTDLEAREALRAWLGGKDETVIEEFEARAYLAPEAFEDRTRASHDLREQLVLEEMFSLPVPSESPASNAIDDVYGDVLEVAEAHALARSVGCTVTVGFSRQTTCPMLHQDNVEQRAFCTLLGRGTEWLAEKQSANAAALITAVQDAQAIGDYGTAAAHKAELESIAIFDRAEERETVLIRGSKWPGVERQAPLHRSPHLPCGGNQFRLVVKVDSGHGFQGGIQNQNQRRSFLAQQHSHSHASCKGACGNKGPCAGESIPIARVLKTLKLK